MLKFILGLLLGYYISSNKEIVEKYCYICINWIKEKCKAIKEKINKKDNSEIV